jgi:hypothetical protein
MEPFFRPEADVHQKPLSSKNCMKNHENNIFIIAAMKSVIADSKF